MNPQITQMGADGLQNRDQQTLKKVPPQSTDNELK